MKKNSLIILFAVFLFFIGCGNSGNDYDKYGDTGDPGKDDDTADTAPDKDSADTADEPADADIQPDDDGETAGDEDNDGSNVDDDSSPQDFWSTCEGIIACAKECTEDDSDCVNSCYTKGVETEQLYYRRWKECFDAECADNKTAECSAEKCSEWDELCNVAEAFEYEFSIPAPYGSIEFAGSFSFILNNSYPTSESQLLFESFASGQISSMPVTPGGTIMSFVRTTTDQRDGKVVEVYQVPYNTSTQAVGNPVVLLRIKTDAATEGDHAVGVGDESEARLIVGEIDSKFNFSCYHAFGIGSFKIDKAVIETGSAGKLSFSKGSAELFNPQNIPELGGDATEILGVEPCSLIR